MLLCKIHVFHLLVPWEMQGFPRSFIARPDAAKFSLLLISISTCHQSETLQSVAYAGKFMGEVINFPRFVFVCYEHTFWWFSMFSLFKMKGTHFSGIMNWIFHEPSTPSKIGSKPPQSKFAEHNSTRTNSDWQMSNNFYASFKVSSDGWWRRLHYDALHVLKLKQWLKHGFRAPTGLMTEGTCKKQNLHPGNFRERLEKSIWHPGARKPWVKCQWRK